MCALCFVSISRILATLVMRLLVCFINIVPWRFHSLVHHHQSLHRQLVTKVKQQRYNSPCKSVPTAFLLTFDLCLALPMVIKGHFGNMDVHLHWAVRWMVPPVGNCLLISCRNV